MKKNIHPMFYQATVTCACGNSFVVGSTRQAIQVDICSACHPFFTGEQKYIDTQGRVEKFMARREIAKAAKLINKAKKIREEKKEERPKTLKEMLQKAK